MTGRSVLRLRERDHFRAQRKGEAIVEVLRDGEVVATIYGTREGIQVVTGLAPHNRVFLMEGAGPTPSWVLPLLGAGEACPWCKGVKIVQAVGGEAPCPVCAGGYA